MKPSVFDGHCDTISRLARMPMERLAGNSGQWDLNRVGDFGQQAQFFAIFWDSSLPMTKSVVKREFKIFQKECKTFRDRIQHCRTAREAKDAMSQGKVAAFLSVEGAELIDCSLEGLQKAYDQGVRAVNLTWNHANALSGSHIDHPEQGLTPLGVEYVRKMQQLGMLVDVSHLSDPGFWDVMETATKPIMASHSNSRAVFSHTRNLTDEQFTAIMKNHGVVGLNAYAAFLGDGAVTGDTLLAHLEHFLSLGGEKNVALGGDWDGCDRLPQGYAGVWSWADLYETLLLHNYPESLVKDLFFNNLMRTVRQVCTM
ncbi:MAG: dipeptidase [Clostridiales bacterium]|nr:dipeptidase [Clostridiales bacterium]